MQHHTIKFVSDLRLAGGFLPGTPVSSTNKTGRHDMAEILLKVALNTIYLHTYIFKLKHQKEMCVCVWRKKLPYLRKDGDLYPNSRLSFLSCKFVYKFIV